MVMPDGTQQQEDPSPGCLISGGYPSFMPVLAAGGCVPTVGDGLLCHMLAGDTGGHRQLFDRG